MDSVAKAIGTLQLVVIVCYKTQLRKWSTVGEIEYTWGENEAGLWEREQGLFIQFCSSNSHKFSFWACVYPVPASLARCCEHLISPTVAVLGNGD